jgi:lipoprotein-anchoring transpeptidase ErfK/SrfK
MARTLHAIVFVAIAAILAVELLESMSPTANEPWSSFIAVDRRTFELGLFERGRLVRTYKIAIGAAGYDTPAGVRRVVYKEKDPAWQAPNRLWAGDVAGQVIPYGDPRNPLKARFLAMGDGLGIHGTTEEWSIGSASSRGCIRMHERDVESLYDRVRVGTPVLIL